MKASIARSWLAVIALLGVCAASGSLRAETEDLSGQGRAEAAGRSLLGSVAPSLVQKTIEGESIDLGKLYGKKAVYLEFWATWCIPCREQMPHLQRTYEKAGDDLAVIAVNIGFNDSRQDVLGFKKRVGLTVPIVIDDGRLWKAFNLRVTPQHVVIGRDQRIQYIGHLADKRLDAALAAARAKSPIDASARHAPQMLTTPQYGVGDRLPSSALASFQADGSDGSAPMVIVFTDIWCESYLASSRPTVSKNCRAVREQVDTLVGPTGPIRWLGVVSGLWTTQHELKEYASRHKPKIRFTLDESGELFRSFQVKSVPTLVIADINGEIVHRIEGFDPQLSTKLHGLRRK